MRDDSVTAEMLEQAEGLIVSGEPSQAHGLLAAAASDIEEYAARNCQATEDEQWFCFRTAFELLAYRRVEGDRRELHVVEEPFDRVYADLALCEVRMGDADAAIEALKQAVRWNPMECSYRLDLAELFRHVGNEQEWLGLSFSVFERASVAAHLVRAFLAFAVYFGQAGLPRVQAACLKSARRILPEDGSVASAVELAAGTEADPDGLSDEEASALLAEQGLPEGASTDLTVCLLMCASDAAQAGDKALATELTVRAYNLVGAPAAEALIALIREGDEELRKEREHGSEA